MCGSHDALLIPDPSPLSSLVCVLLKFPSQAEFPSPGLAPKRNSLETFSCVHLAIVEGKKVDGVGGIWFLLLFGT